MAKPINIPIINCTTFHIIYISPYSLIASHTNSHSNANTGLITNSNNNSAMLGLMNNIIINNNIIIYFSLYLIAVLGIEPTYHTCHAVLPLDYTTNYDHLILLFLTISSWYLIRYYIVKHIPR